MKLLSLIVCSFSLCLFNGNSFNSSENNYSFQKPKTALRASNTQEKSPFICLKSLPNRITVKDPIGYFVYDMSIYCADFTDASKLYLCETMVDFTPGSAATKNEDGYDWHYDFWAANIKIGVPTDFSSAKIKDYWPKSSTITTTITSSFSNNYSFSSGVGADLGGGATISGSSSMGVTISHQTLSTSEEPTISSQISSANSTEVNWNIQCTVQRGLTYNFACYYLLEVPNSIHKQFSYFTNIDMTCIAWKGYLWEQRKHVVTNNSLSC